MADPAPAPDPSTPAPTPDPAPAVPAGNLVADAAPPASPAPSSPAPTPALAVAAIDPAVARSYLTEHGVSAEDVAKIPEADLAKRYDEAKAAEAAKPIEYKDFKFPEGVALDAKLLSALKTDFASAKLSQEQAQALIDKHVAGVKASTDANIAAFTKLQNDWKAEVMADPQVGGAAWETKTAPAIAKFISTFCPDEASAKAFRDAVTLTGIGNHPAYVRALARAGASLMEGQPATGAPLRGKEGQKSFDSIASNLYPDQSK